MPEIAGIARSRPVVIGLRPRLLALLLACAGCATERASNEVPDWVSGRISDTDRALALFGTGSAPGTGPEAAELARQRALAAILQQLSVDVRAESTTRDREQVELSRHDAVNGERAIARSDTDRSISLSTAGQLPGVQFELANGIERGAAVTYALARVERAELAHELERRAAQALELAQRQLTLAREGLAAPVSAATSRGIVATLAAEPALAEVHEPLLLLRVAAGNTAAVRALDARLLAAGKELAALRTELERNLHITEAGAPPELRLSGHLGPVALQVRWGSEPLPALPMAARLGRGALAHSLTDAAGQVVLRVPAVAAVAPRDASAPASAADAASGAGAKPGSTALIIDAGPALDGRLTTLVTPLPVSVPGAATSRVAVLTRHERLDGPDAQPPVVRQPSAAQGDIEQALGSLHHPVVRALLPPGTDVLAATVPGQLIDQTDYALIVRSRSMFRSREGREQSGVFWYGTELEARFVDVVTGEAFTLSVPESQTRDAGASPEQAGQRSLAKALTLLLDPQRAESLPSTLATRFR